MNYSRLHPCITFSLSPARCAQRQQNTECTKLHISLVERLWIYAVPLSGLSPSNVVHSIFLNRNHFDDHPAVYCTLRSVNAD